MTMAMIGSVAAPAVGGILGSIFDDEDQEAAQEAYKNAVAEIMAVGAPPDLSKEIIIQKFQQAGIYNPDVEKNINQLTSAVSQIKEDVGIKQQQATALSDLAKRGRAGFTLEDRAALDKVRGTLEGDYQAKLKAMQQQLQARGASGSGQELAMQLQSASDTANRASTEGIDIGAQALRQALQATSSAGQLAGQMREQDLGYQKLTKGAEDELNRFNISGQRDIQQRNIAEQNRARLANVQREQAISDANTKAANQELYRQAEAKRQYWQDQLSRAQARAGALTGQSGFYNQQAANTRQMWQGIGSGVGAASGAGANYAAQNAAQDRADARVNKLLNKNNAPTQQDEAYYNWLKS